MNDVFLRLREDKIKFCSKIAEFCTESLQNSYFLINMPDEQTGSIKRSFSTRIKKANKSKANLFVSINTGFDENEDKNIYKCSYFKGVKSFSRNGKKLADFICSEFKENIPEIVTESFGASYAVLRDTNMTAVYIEVGNMNNKIHARQLADTDFQKKTGRCIAEALKKFVTEDL